MKNTVIKIKSIHDNTPYDFETSTKKKDKKKKKEEPKPKRVTMDVDLMLDDDTILVDVRDLEMKGVTELIVEQTDSGKPIKLSASFEALFDVVQIILVFDS